MYVVLSIVTCGIFALFWLYQIAKDFYDANTPNNLGTSPGVTLLLSIVTGGIYGIYAYYKWGKQTPEIAAMYGQYGEDRSTLYLVLSIFGLGIVNMCLIQNDFNLFSSNGAQYYQQNTGYGSQPYPPPAPGTDPYGYQQAPPPTPASSYAPPQGQPVYPPPEAAQPYPQQPPVYPPPQTAQPYQQPYQQPAPPAGYPQQPPEGDVSSPDSGAAESSGVDDSQQN